MPASEGNLGNSPRPRALPEVEENFPKLPEDKGNFRQIPLSPILRPEKKRGGLSQILMRANSNFLLLAFSQETSSQVKVFFKKISKSPLTGKSQLKSALKSPIVNSQHETKEDLR